MNELIKVEDRNIGDGQVQTINARDLHTFLGNGDNFTTWIKDRIQQYGFIENHDFVSFSENTKKPQGGRPAIEYFVTLDMGKELAMVERNEKGKQARQYFIECEKRASARFPDVHAMLSSPDSLRQLLSGYVDKVIEQKAVIEQQEAIIEEQAPKAEFHDAVADSINRQTMQQLAKELNVGPNKLFEFLRTKKVLIDDKRNLPYQRYIDAGYFRVIMRQYTDDWGEERISSRTFVTGKGAIYIQKLAKDHPELEAGARKKKVTEDKGNYAN